MSKKTLPHNCDQRYIAFPITSSEVFPTTPDSRLPTPDSLLPTPY
ncbi:hypothetical protein [Moorena sp. SIO3I6]|nr:hypothetical protein [Moorena sp. SIO3I6]